MATMRCGECHAVIPVPAALEVTTVACPYCHSSQTVPDLEARRRLSLEREREARLAEVARSDAERAERQDAREARERDRDRRAARRGRWGSRLMTLIAMLAAPTIIAITVYDLPARLGFGPSGADRLEQLRAQLAAGGCSVIRDVESSYASSTVSQLVEAPADRCLRLFAAGGGGHNQLGLRLFGPSGEMLASDKGSIDPQLTHCVEASATLRYQIELGPAAKGRLSHMVLACPRPPAAPSRPPRPAR